MRKKLRIGLLVNSPEIPFWAYKMLERIGNSHFAEICLIIKNAPEEKKKSFLRDLWEKRHILFYLLYIKLENIIFKTKPDAFEPRRLDELLNCPTLCVQPIQKKFSDYFQEDDIKTIRSYELDVLIRLGFRVLKGSILQASKYGIWSYHHGDNQVNKGGPAGAWEVLQKHHETGVTLQILTEDLDDGWVLDHSFSCTDKISIKRNKNNLYWKALSMLPRKLEELYQLGENAFFEKVREKNNSIRFYYNELFKTPTNFVLFRYVLKNYWGILKEKIGRKFHFDQWTLLFHLSKKEALSTSFFKFKRIVPPKDRFWADPFVIYKNQKYYIFIEELTYNNYKGHISVIEMDEKGNHGAPKKVLEKDYHLSYPFLIEENGNLYMIPETAQNKSIELYKCTSFPYQWQLEKVLMDNVCAVDTTILKKDGKYWLFANIKENEGASTYDELFLFSAHELVTDNWEPHPLNPIISDVKTARPAGSIFSHKNKWYRPAQNCSKHYGYGMQIKEILELNDTSYKEVLIQSIYPDWDTDLIATHTLNHEKHLTVSDALIRRRKYF